VKGWQLGVVLWLAFNGSVLLFAWLSYRDGEPGPEPAWNPEPLDMAMWEAELAESDRDAAMRWHPAGGNR
jgi:hypothetical protein